MSSLPLITQRPAGGLDGYESESNETPANATRATSPEVLVRNPAYRSAPDTRAIGLGRTLSGHQNESFRVQHDHQEIKLFLHRERHRVAHGTDGTQPKWGYRFETLE